MKENTYILTLSCPDVRGIVAGVANFLVDHGGFILESAQFGDGTTATFFMRIVFQMQHARAVVVEKFGPIAKKFGMDYRLKNLLDRPKTLIMVSHHGHCLNHLLHRTATGFLPIDIAGIVSNRSELKEMASWQDHPFHLIAKHEEDKLMKLLSGIDLVILARYMQILSPKVCQKMHGRVINIHHSFLPSFKGAKPYHQAYEKGVKVIGATAHYATEDLDEGPIIEQETTHVNHTHSPQDLVALGYDMENRVLTRAIKWHVEQRIVLNQHKTVVFQ